VNDFGMIISQLNERLLKEQEQDVRKLEKHFKGSLPIEDGDWQVGVIVGAAAPVKHT
jgi:hypothetical protein